MLKNPGFARVLIGSEHCWTGFADGQKWERLSLANRPLCVFCWEHRSHFHIRVFILKPLRLSHTQNISPPCTHDAPSEDTAVDFQAGQGGGKKVPSPKHDHMFKPCPVNPKQDVAAGPPVRLTDTDTQEAHCLPLI